MDSDKIILAVNEVYKDLDGQIAQIALKSGMKCPQLCNACCRKTDIEASPIEFISLAAWLYENGKVDDFMAHLDQNDETGYCVLFDSEAWKNGKWACLNYEKRGLICRLFGFGYRLNRDELPELVTCKVMKETLPEAVSKARLIGIETPDEIPLFRNYSMRLYSIYPELAVRQLPINKAIRLAIEKLYFHYSPRMKRESIE